MNDTIEIDCKKEANRTILSVKGNIDSHTVAQFDNALKKAKENSLFIDIDMSKVNFLSSMGIRSLLLAYRQLTAQKGEFRVISPSEPVKNVMGMVNLNLMLVK